MAAMEKAGGRPSVNRLAAPLADRLVADAAALRLCVTTGPLGCRLVGVTDGAPGGLEAGRRIAEICLGGLGRVALTPTGEGRWPFAVSVHAADPVIACLGSQYAGWALEAPGWSALGSGPARAMAALEPLYAEIGYRDEADRAVLVVEVDRPPPEAVVATVAAATGLDPTALTLVHAPTASLAGSVQVAARVLEVALHKARGLGFRLDCIIDGLGSAPLPPPSPDRAIAMGRTNDAIIYAGRVHLFVAADDDTAAAMAAGLPSRTAREHGRPFAEVFRDAGEDFHAVNPALFSPAEVMVTSLETGRTFRGGSTSPDLLDASFS